MLIIAAAIPTRYPDRSISSKIRGKSRSFVALRSLYSTTPRGVSSIQLSFATSVTVYPLAALHQGGPTDSDIDDVPAR
jgi:hypothetical protein